MTVSQLVCLSVKLVVIGQLVDWLFDKPVGQPSQVSHCCNEGMMLLCSRHNLYKLSTAVNLFTGFMWLSTGTQW